MCIRHTKYFVSPIAKLQGREVFLVNIGTSTVDLRFTIMGREFWIHEYGRICAIQMPEGYVNNNSGYSKRKVEYFKKYCKKHFAELYEEAKRKPAITDAEMIKDAGFI